MKAIEAARKVYSEHQCMLMRPKKGVEGEYDMKDAFSGKKNGWFYLDGFTASAICKVYDACNESNQAKLNTLSIERLASISWKMVA